MKTRIFFSGLFLGLVVLSANLSAQVPQLINYQGKLTKSTGAPLDTTIQMVFTIYADSNGISSKWSESQGAVKVEKGVFNVLLGSVNLIPDTVFDGSIRYLGVRVGGDPEIIPRKSMVSVPYAMVSGSGGGGSDNEWKFRITDTADTSITTCGNWGIARYGAAMLGYMDSTHVNLGVACTTGSSTNSNKYCTVAGGILNTASESATTVGGGYHNIANGFIATVGGGEQNTASSDHATIGGGYYNNASGFYATVGGGHSNSASGAEATVGGGYADTAAGDFSIASGYRVRLSSDADYTFAFGNNFSTSTSHAVIFHDTDIPIKVGIGTTSPAERLDVAGTAQMTGFKMSTGASNGYVLTSDAGGVGTWQAVTGLPSGTSGQTLRHDGTNWVANSQLYNDGGNVGIGTTSPTQKLDVVGTVKMTGFRMPTGASTGYVLTSDAGGVGTWQVASGIGGSGTANYIPKFTGATTLGNSAIYQSASNVGIGTTSPTTTLHVQGDALVKSAGGSVALSGSDGAMEVWGTDGAFIDLKDAEGDDFDFRITQIGGTGNLGFVGGGVGIGTTSPQNKLDVEGSAVVGAGYSGTTVAPFSGFLVEGKVGIGTTSPQNKLDVEGNAVIGATYSGTNAAPTNGFLVEGKVGIGTTDPLNAKLNVSATGTDLAVYGHTTGSNYAGYFEVNNSSANIYALEVETNANWAAVRGYSSGAGGAGRFQINNASNSSDALYVSTNGTGKAGYFSGDVQVTGNLSKGGGSFKIDHPLDPENKYLYHSFVESPDMKNVYDGVVLLDANGEAKVELPHYFETLNKDFRYQLTAIGAPSPNLYIAQEISDNNFKIAGGQPGMKVSWQVTGIRKDPYAEKHRIPVEEEKPAKERGTYLHPDAYSLGEQYGVNYEEQKRMEQEHH